MIAPRRHRRKNDKFRSSNLHFNFSEKVKNIAISAVQYLTLEVPRNFSRSYWSFLYHSVHESSITRETFMNFSGSIVFKDGLAPLAWWRHQMETFSTLLAICAGNSPVSGDFPATRPVTRSFDIFFDLRLNKRLSKLWWGWWFESPSCPLWRHSNGCVVSPIQVTYVYGTGPWKSKFRMNLIQADTVIPFLWDMSANHPNTSIPLFSQTMNKI